MSNGIGSNILGPDGKLTSTGVDHIQGDGPVKVIPGKVGTFSVTREGSQYKDHAVESRKVATAFAVRMDRHFIVDSEEGPLFAEPGDYLMEGPQGESWSIKGHIFEDTYVPVEET